MNMAHNIVTADQSIWPDDIDRHPVRSGELQQMVEPDGICGVTSNPAIFEKAIRTDAAYASALRQPGDSSPAAFFERLAIEDIRASLEEDLSGCLKRSVYE